MKVIKCELCEGRNVLKQNGVYICQDCGAQYTVEEAKALMVEVSNGETVSRAIPTAEPNSQINNFRQLARRAREAGNVENAAKYYEMVVIQDPNDWEAAFYSVYYQAAGTNIAGIVSAAANVGNCLPSVMNLIEKRVPKEEQSDVLNQIAKSIVVLSETMYSTARNHYNQFQTASGAANEFYARREAVYDMVLEAADLISKLDYKEIASPLLDYLYSKNDLSYAQRDKVNSILDIVNPSQAQRNRNAEKERQHAGNSKYISGVVMALLGIVIAIASVAVASVPGILIGVILAAIGFKLVNSWKEGSRVDIFNLKPIIIDNDIDVDLDIPIQNGNQTLSIKNTIHNSFSVEVPLRIRHYVGKADRLTFLNVLESVESKIQNESIKTEFNEIIESLKRTCT